MIMLIALLLLLLVEMWLTLSAKFSWKTLQLILNRRCHSRLLFLGRVACTYSASDLLLPVGFLVRSACSSVCPSVCPLVTNAYCRKTAESIEIPFGAVIGEGQRKVWDRCLRWRHLVYTVERLCAAAMSGSVTWVATRPLSKLLWGFL